MKKIILTILLALFTLSAFAENDNNNLSLSMYIDGNIASKHLLEASYGIYIERIDTGQVLYEKNAHKTFQPASNRKILTAAFALENLSPAFEYVTEVYSDGAQTGDILNGDIIVKALGDPTFHPAYDNKQSYNYPFNEWAAKIKASGIKTIKGNIFIDVSLYREYDEIPDGWAWGQLKDSYASPTSAFASFENCVTVTVKPGPSSGTPLKYSVFPDVDSIVLENNGRTSLKRELCNVDILRSPVDKKYVLQGYLGTGASEQTLRLPFNDPNYQTAEIFKKTLEKSGIIILGQIVISYDKNDAKYQGAKLLHSHKSPPLANILQTTLYRSNNFFAEQIFKSVSALRNSEGSYASSVAMERRLWNKWNLPVNEVLSGDGSGLSRDNLVSPYFIAQLLKKIDKTRPEWKFRELLPSNGKNGTLRGRLNREDLVDKISAKTGTLKHVSCLSGYITTKSGVPVVFSIMMNNSINEGDGVLTRIQDKICEKVILEYF